MEIIVLANQKGGVGKTTTAMNLATALAAVGKKILVIDLDPQGNLSTGFGLPQKRRKATSYDLLFEGREVDGLIQPTNIPNLHIIPASLDLSGADLSLAPLQNREFILKSALEPLAGSYDYIFIDCPPALGLLTLNAFVAASGVLVPLQCEFYALEGLSFLMKTLKHIRARFNPHLQLFGILLTMFDRRNKLSKQVAEEARGYFKEKVFYTDIPRNVKVSEAPSHGKPVLLYDIYSSGAQAYIHLAKEILRRKQKARRIKQPLKDLAS